VRIVLALVLAFVVAGCHAGDTPVTVYFKQRLGGDGPHGQVVPVLEPVERDRRPHMNAAWQALLELRQGPTPGERALGFEPTLELDARPLSVSVRGSTAIVHLARPASFYAAAAIVYTLTEVDGIDRVGFRVDGRACCLPMRDGSSEPATDRSRYRYWTGEPCELRTRADQVRCRRDH
jgi:Sporulation and spore germination